jgi:hypothetical protein
MPTADKGAGAANSLVRYSARHTGAGGVSSATEAGVSTTAPVTRELLERALKEIDQSYLTDSDGDLRVSYALDDKAGFPPAVFLFLEDNFLRYMMSGTFAVPRARWGEALAALNEWHEARRWPRAFLYIKDVEKDDAAPVVADWAIDVEKGASTEQLGDWYRRFLGSALELFQWLHGEKQFR